MSKTHFSFAAGLQTVRFASKEAVAAAEEAGLVYPSFTNIQPGSEYGFTAADVRKAAGRAEEDHPVPDSE